MMAEDKKPMPADGDGTSGREHDGNGELASRRDDHTGGDANAGESGGGAYPSPHESEHGDGGFQGGQSNQGYYGNGQLGDKDVGESENSVSSED